MMTQKNYGSKIYNNISHFTLSVKNKKYRMIENRKRYYAENQRIASNLGSGYESKDSKDSIDRNDFFQIILDILDYQ
jgi:hypothetical protein